MSDKVKFDPGIGYFVVDFNNFINDVYSQLMSFRTIHQKRARFKLYSNKIITNIKNNIAFYLGCLLWAYYIKKVNADNPKEIEGNVFLNMTEEEKNNYDYMIQVNFMENYFDSYERDFLYYTGQETKIPEIWKQILSLYIEFLEKNKGFINTRTTADIILPDSLKNKEISEDINTIIKEAIEKKDLNLLLNIENIVL
ncbi:TPA: hypothetical protein IAA87_00430 [Candidatus Avigastranaerophilus faecigallinarum]|nr:hypothetical protein [Candidatus Avigastranaerophilus faecigallinarum]